MFVELVNIVAGLVLLTGFLRVVPVVGGELEELARWLGSFQTLIGVVAIVAGLLNLPGLQGVVAIIAGLVLVTGLLPNIPTLGIHLERLARWLGSFQTIIGVVAILVGAIGLF